MELYFVKAKEIYKWSYIFLRLVEQGTTSRRLIYQKTISFFLFCRPKGTTSFSLSLFFFFNVYEERLPFGMYNRIWIRIFFTYTKKNNYSNIIIFIRNQFYKKKITVFLIFINILILNMFLSLKYISFLYFIITNKGFNFEAIKLLNLI